MNMPDNVFKLGNYRYRPTTSSSKFFTLPIDFDQLDSGGYYTGATDSNVVVNSGFNDDIVNPIPQIFKSTKDKIKMIYSLDDCIKPFRPRSGINKASYFKNRFLANSGASLAERPRYYMASRYDQFKYWTSYRTEDNSEYGVAKNITNGNYYIDDTAPFVVYKDPVPANRLVIKMQTNVGTADLGPFKDGSKLIDDPLYGSINQTTPDRWKVQYLKDNNWVNAYSFNENSLRDNGSSIIGPDGYLELQYGIIIPDDYKDIFVYAEKISSITLLPQKSYNGYAYLVQGNESDVGTFHIWNSTTSAYETFVPNYGWQVGSEEIKSQTSFIKDLTNQDFFIDNINQSTVYREFDYVRGIRIVVETMNKFDSTFDLIEMSPRLVVDISDKVTDFKITKILSDVGITSMPVGQLLASTGTLDIFDDDQAFNENNTLSIISKYIRKNIKFNFYEVVLNVDGYDYFVPIKTLYSEGVPQANDNGATLSLTLRDLFFFLESMPAPRMLTTQTSLSYAVSLILDYIGFSNYSFKRTAEESEMVIPYFFIAPDQNVAEVLNELARASQSSMFFDENNNFIVMSKDYLMPTESQRATDFVISGSNNQTDTGEIENASSGKLPNLISIASQDKKIYNDGRINYTERYIQRSLGKLKQAALIDNDQTWIYKPSLLWEVAGTPTTKTRNEVAQPQGNYILGAMPLNSDLSLEAPSVVSGVLVNNIIDFGENIIWLTRNQGYFYSNGEIIKYDAVQYSVTLPLWYEIKADGKLSDTNPQIVLPGRLAPSSITDDTEILKWRNTHKQGSSNVWISSNEEYQKYFSSLPFNGKIYPTGLVRIYSTPYYETIGDVVRLKNGAVVDHGRGQFNTPLAYHTAGVNPYWSNNDYVRGCNMESQYLFTNTLIKDIATPTTVVGVAGENNTLAKQTTRNGIIKNFMSTAYLTETSVNNLQSTQTGTVQSSALVINGPSFKGTENPINFVSYVYKELNNAYKHFGTRVRIIGKTENDPTNFQTPIGITPYYQITGSNPEQDPNISGAGGGIAVLLNPETNNGYYFEITGLNKNNIESYFKFDNAGNATTAIDNIVFYKIKKDASSSKAIPVKLWGGSGAITVDDGSYVGQYRLSGEENPTVYDLSVEYEDIGKVRRFYLYINNKIIQVVEDSDPLPIYNNMALFTRGSARCMFENVYALSENYSQNTVASTSPEINNVFGQTQNSNNFNRETGLFGKNEINENESFRKYAMSGVVQSAYLSGISSQQPPKYNMYFEEFGSIMRECSYFDIKYDRAFPALSAQISPTFNRIKSYVVSGFQANSYGAEFLVFNSTDKAINLDESTQSFLRIQGITFTQDTTHELTVDEFFKKRSNMSDPELTATNQIISPFIEKEKYDRIRQSRMTYGKNEFSIDSQYIQTQDSAESLMNWIINKVMEPKKIIGANIFSIPILQLGDIVTLDYKDSNGLDLVTADSTRFVIYNINYSRNQSGPSMTVYLSEV